MVERARERFSSEILDGRLTIVQGAVAATPGRIRFFICDTMSAWSTTDFAIAEQHKRVGAIFREVIVDAVPFADILRKYGIPHYLKVDIEGCDLLCVKAFSEISERPDSLSVEVNLFDHGDLIRLASDLGYRKFQIVPQSTIPEQRVPVPSREGRDTDFKLVGGCTGLFGADLPDDWKTADESLSSLNALWWRHKMIGALTRLGKPLGLGGLLRVVNRVPAGVRRRQRGGHR